MNNRTVVCVVGPTASGKTSLAVEIAKKLDGEIISADSMQIYKHMNIATAKPTEDEMQGIPHHLIDFVEPWENFSVAKFKKLCTEKIIDIQSRGKLPIIAGGTGFYVDTVVNNTEFLDSEDNRFRELLQKKQEEYGTKTLYDELMEIDRETAEKLNEGDTKRIIRALELYYSTGRTMTEQRENSHLKESEFSFCIIGLSSEDRQFLYDRINRRVDLMIESGLIKEAEDFFNLECSSTSKQAIGYKELKPYLDNEITLNEAVEKLRMETRRYAKRQLTWFRRNKDINWLYIDRETKEALLQKSLSIIRNFSGE